MDLVPSLLVTSTWPLLHTSCLSDLQRASGKKNGSRILDLQVEAYDGVERGVQASDLSSYGVGLNPV